MDKIKPGTYVIVAGTLGTVQREARRGRADGYQVHEGGAYTRFASAFQVEPARIGVNVCTEPRIPEWCCPLVHVSAVELERIRAQG